MTHKKDCTNVSESFFCKNILNIFTKQGDLNSTEGSYLRFWSLLNFGRGDARQSTRIYGQKSGLNRFQPTNYRYL